MQQRCYTQEKIVVVWLEVGFAMHLYQELAHCFGSSHTHMHTYTCTYAHAHTNIVSH